jgi:hypothetical protein
MIVLSLIALGFAQVSRREQRSALDRQLSTEAYYAAESGINDARKAIFDTSNSLNPYLFQNGSRSKSSCGADTLPNDPLDSGSQINGTVQYSCLLINQSPPDIQITQAAYPNPGNVEPINPTLPLHSLLISWEADGNGQGIPLATYPKFPSLGAGWGGANTVPLLRIDLVDASNLNRTALDTSVFTAFLYPVSSATPGVGAVTVNAPGSSQSGQIVKANCNTANTPYFCNVMLNVPAGITHDYLRVNSVYNGYMSNISSGGTVANETFTGAQAIIDSTGKATDVLKRIQVRIPIPSTPPTSTNAAPGNNKVPPYSIESAGSICKTLDALPPPQATVANPC